jgi:hypothetical protein
VTVEWLWEVAANEGGLWLGPRGGEPTVLLHAERDHDGRRVFVASQGSRPTPRRAFLVRVQRAYRRLLLSRVERAYPRLRLPEVRAYLERSGATHMTVGALTGQRIAAMTTYELVALAASYRAGEPTVMLTAENKAQAIERLALHRPGAAVSLVQYSSAAELAQMMSTPQFREALRQIRDDQHAGPWLVELLEERFPAVSVADMMAPDHPAVGPADGAPPRTFDPQRLADALENTTRQDFLAASRPPVLTEFLALPLREQALATRWLQQRWAQLAPTAQRPQLTNQAAVIQSMLDAVYSTVARRMPPPELVRDVLIPPSPGQYDQLIAALTPKARPSTEPRSDDDYRQALRDGFRQAYDILDKDRGGWTEQVHASLEEPFTLEHYGRMAGLMSQVLRKVFGRLADPPILSVNDPDAPHQLLDRFVVLGELYQRMSPGERRRIAEHRLRYLLVGNNILRRASRAYGQFPMFGYNGEPLNDAGRVARGVLNELLADDAWVERILQHDRRWVAWALPPHVYIQLFPEGESAQDKRKSVVRYAGLILHELVHLMEHRDYYQLLRRFRPGSAQFNTLKEGVTTLLTRMGWHTEVAPRLTESGPLDENHFRRVIEGLYADLPPMTDPVGARDYASLYQVYEVLRINGIERLLVGYLHGLIEYIASERVYFVFE